MIIDDELKQARFLNLGTFRRSGKRVDTPVWAAERDGVFYAFSKAQAGKVKRLKNSPRATLAVCDTKGVALGERHEAQAFLVTDEREIGLARQALVEKYGLVVRLSNAFGWLTGGFEKRAVLKIVLS